MNAVTELQTPLILEIETEDFVGVLSILTSHGYRILARADNPSRHVLRDDAAGDEPPSAA